MKNSHEPGFLTERGYRLKNRREGALSPALEDYLEMVFRLCEELGYARVGRLSQRLHVKPSSASKMIFKLVDLGYLEYDSCDSILLTERGRGLGAYLLERHRTVERFLSMVGSAIPLEEAELTEHALSPDSVRAIQTLLAFFDQNPDLQERYAAFRKDRSDQAAE